ncbi:MAG: hypothetical protein H3C54_02840 [Taibaiella sp.]|nr:hypothetical protein [Taibaiella sp.]
MKKLFINHVRFMALPAIISAAVQMVCSYQDGKLNIKEACEILLAGVMLILLLFPVYLVLRAIWRKLFVQKAENQ